MDSKDFVRTESFSLRLRPTGARKVTEEFNFIMSAFLNVRVADLQSFYESRKELGAKFITELKDHSAEFRCYMVDPDGYLIEIGEAKPRE
jgi:predicted lactoylglutathione lyase